MIASSKFCSESDQASRSQNVKAGENIIAINVCLQDGQALESTVIIKPIFVEPPQNADPVAGEELYSLHGCASCHGDQGQGATFGPIKGEECTSCSSRQTMIEKIMKDMPPGAKGSCDRTCANNIIEFISPELK